MEIFDVLEKYGWLGIFIYYLVKELSPFVINKWFPEKQKELQAKRASDALLLKSQIDRDDKDAEHRRNFEDRIVSAMEQMSLTVTVNNERLSQLIAITATHNDFTVEAVGDMRERAAKLHRDTNPKIKKAAK